MGWSLRLGTVGGTDILVHFTFFLLLAWIGTALWIGRGYPAAVDGVVFVAAVFACVVLHELGHAFAARRYGIRTRWIALLPIGGLASLDRVPEQPRQEVVVALAGPAVNLLIAALLVLLLGARLDLGTLDDFGAEDASPLSRLATVNVVLAVFNLIPAFPMDGGRVLRALLGFAMPRAKATRIAAGIGQFLAIGLGFLGLMGNPMLVLIAIFVWFAANSEAYSVSMHDFARGRPVADAMITHFEPLRPGATLDDAARLLLATTQREFPVLDNEHRLAGLLTKQTVIEGLANGQGQAAVASVMATEIPSISLLSSLERAVELLEFTAAPGVAVCNVDGTFAGYVTLENLAEFFLIRNAGAMRTVTTSSVQR